MPDPDKLTINVADFTTRFAPKPGDLFVVSCPLGFRPEEVEAAASDLDEVLQHTGASAIFLLNGMTLEKLESELVGWMAREGLALRGYPVPGSDCGEVRYRVLHPTLGQLSEAVSHLEAIRNAQIALGPQTPPEPVLEKDSQVVTRQG